MDLHGQIMNIQIIKADISRAIEEVVVLGGGWEDCLMLAYKFGHRDARHAAAELVVIKHIELELGEN